MRPSGLGHTAAVLTVLAAPAAMLTGNLPMAFGIPGDFSTTPSPSASDPPTSTMSGEARQALTVSVDLTLDADRGQPGLTVRATASLMVQCASARTGTLSISWDSVTSLTPANVAVADSASGSIAFTFTVPATADPGPHTVSAVCGPPNDLISKTHNAFTYSGSAAFTVDQVEKPTLTASPDQGPPGTRVTASGAEFVCDTDLTLQWDDGTVLADHLPDAFTSHFSVPTGASVGSDHSITVSCLDDPDNAVSQPFTVTPAALSTTVTPGTSQVVSGKTVFLQPTRSETSNMDTARHWPPSWLVPLIAVIVAAALTGAGYFYRRSRGRATHAGPHARAVPHFDTAPTVTLRETPAAGEVACCIGIVPHQDPGSQTFVEVSS
ncbi:hypothetical protein [Mycolicibacterium brisbanense]